MRGDGASAAGTDDRYHTGAAMVACCARKTLGHAPRTCGRSQIIRLGWATMGAKSTSQEGRRAHSFPLPHQRYNCTGHVFKTLVLGGGRVVAVTPFCLTSDCRGDYAQCSQLFAAWCGSSAKRPDKAKNENGCNKYASRGPARNQYVELCKPVGQSRTRRCVAVKVPELVRTRQFQTF